MDFQEYVNMFVRDEETVHASSALFTPTQLRNVFEGVLAPFQANGWPMPTDPALIVETAISDYEKFYTPAPPPSTKFTNFAYNYPDGTKMPTSASLAGKNIGDTIIEDGITYYLINYFSGVSKLPRWSLTPTQQA